MTATRSGGTGSTTTSSPPHDGSAVEATHVEHCIARVEPADLERFLSVLELAAGRAPTPDVIDDERRRYERCERLAAFDGERIVGGTGFDVVELTLPGKSVAQAARIMLTAVLPTHRRRGLVRALWTRQLHDIRRLGVPLAIFTTSGPGIYTRFGYSPATRAVSVTLDTRRVTLAPTARERQPLTMRLLERNEIATIVEDVFARHRLCQPGQVSRPRSFWNLWLADRAMYREDRSERFVAAAFDSDGAAQGYVSYRLTYGALREEPVRVLHIEELVPATDDARRVLWRFCVDFDQATAIRVDNVAADDPLCWMLDDPRAFHIVGVSDFLWLRLVDVTTALTARRYGTADSFVIDVNDDVLPENAGRYRLDGDEHGGSCERTDAHPDLVLDVRALAAVYLGGATVRSLECAGTVSATDASTVRRADAFFASTPGPWTVTDL
jgi:predicted acetyltransferase